MSDVLCGPVAELLGRFDDQLWCQKLLSDIETVMTSYYCPVYLSDPIPPVMESTDDV